MVKRRLYQSSHPIYSYPFEAFSHGSWRIVEHVRIKGGRLLMHFENPGFETNGKVSLANLRIRSRKAASSDCICFLRPGVDVCVHSTLPNTTKSSQEIIIPIWVDAKISSIERKPHGHRCSCKFYINFYRTRNSLNYEKSTLSREINEVGIENIAILQQLGRNPCEGMFYRWSSSKDCHSRNEAKLSRGQFSSDVSWLLVTSYWRQIDFCVRSVQNMLIYQILGCDRNMRTLDSDYSLKTMTFQVDNGILRPRIRHYVSMGPVQSKQEDEFLSFYDTMNLRRSKRRNVQPERFLGFDDLSEANPFLICIEKKKENRCKEEATIFGISSQVETSTAYERSAEETYHFGQAPHSIDASKQNMEMAKFSLSNDVVSTVNTFKGVSPTISTPGKCVQEKLSKVSSKICLKKVMPTLQKRNKSEEQNWGVESRWKEKVPQKRLRRNNCPAPSKREICFKAKSVKRRCANASEHKQMIEMCMKEIDMEIKKEHPAVVAQWEVYQAKEPQDQRRDGNWASLINRQEECSELEVLWKEMELSMATNHFLEDNQGTNVEVFDGAVGESNKLEAESCQHKYMLDEEIGIICQLCRFINTEIRYVLPAFLQNECWITNKGLADDKELDEHGDLDFFCNADSSKDVPLSEEESENVWALIPDLRKKLHLHQEKAFEFLWRNIAGSLIPALMEPSSESTGGCVIFHPPGAGKTLLVIAFLISYLKLFPGQRPLILAPKTTLYTWSKEIKKWDISIPVYQIYSRLGFKKEIHSQTMGESPKDPKLNQDMMHVMDCLEKILKWHAHPSILLMGYTSFFKFTQEELKCGHRKFMGTLLQQSPGILILDEGHNPRSTESMLRKALMKVKTKLRILLSGTLFQNNFKEYFNTLCLARPTFVSEVLRKLDPHVGKTRKEMKGKNILSERRARKIFMESIATKINSSEEQERDLGLSMLRDITNGFIDAYEGENSNKLPGFQSYTLLIKPTSIQQGILSKLQDLMLNVMCKGYPLELELLISLASIHPWLIKTIASVNKYFNEEEVEELEKHRLDVKKGSKVRFVVSLLHKCIIKGEKVLIFCHNIAPINLLVEICEMIFGWRMGEEVLVLQGYQELCERGRVIDKFEERGGTSRVLLASIRSCSEGISLTAASRLVLLDSEWNPSTTKQAIARAYRPGQERDVYVYQLLACGTLEEEKFVRTAWKEWVSSMIFNGALEGDSSCRQTERIDDGVLREIVEEDQAKSFHQIMKNEKVQN